MSQNKDRLKFLMQKYLDRSCSVEERNELVKLIGQTGHPDEMDDLWQKVWVENYGSIQLEELNWEELMSKNKADQMGHLGVISRKVFKWSVAAAVVMGLYFVAHWWMQGSNMVIYETGYGERLEFVLDDGTTVNLNADSKIAWNNNWLEKGIREIKLEGEAYFDVSHVDQNGNPDKEETNITTRIPFQVITSDLTIRVLGTAFNTFQRRGKTEVFLERGEVEVSLRNSNDKKTINQLPSTSKVRGKTSIDSDPVEVIRMKPGDWVSFSSEKNVLEQKEVEKPKALSEWKDGTLSYQDVEFRLMLQSLEDLYGKSFKVDDPLLLNRRVNVGVPYEDWDTVMDMMEIMLGIEVKELEGDAIQIKNGKDINM